MEIHQEDDDDDDDVDGDDDDGEDGDIDADVHVDSTPPPPRLVIVQIHQVPANIPHVSIFASRLDPRISQTKHIYFPLFLPLHSVVVRSRSQIVKPDALFVVFLGP